MSDNQIDVIQFALLWLITGGLISIIIAELEKKNNSLPVINAPFLLTIFLMIITPVMVPVNIMIAMFSRR